MNRILEEDARRIEKNPSLLAYLLGVRDTILVQKNAKKEAKMMKRRRSYED